MDHCFHRGQEYSTLEWRWRHRSTQAKGHAVEFNALRPDFARGRISQPLWSGVACNARGFRDKFLSTSTFRSRRIEFENENSESTRIESSDPSTRSAARGACRQHAIHTVDLRLFTYRKILHRKNSNRNKCDVSKKEIWYPIYCSCIHFDHVFLLTKGCVYYSIYFLH